MPRKTGVERREFKMGMTLHEGYFWGLHEHFLARIRPTGADFSPPPGALTPAPKAFIDMLAACPGPEARVTPVRDEETAMENGSAVFDFGPARAQDQYMTAIIALHGRELEWRVLTWEGPIFALKAGVVVGALSPLMPKHCGES